MEYKPVQYVNLDELKVLFDQMIEELTIPQKDLLWAAFDEGYTDKMMEWIILSLPTSVVEAIAKASDMRTIYLMDEELEIDLDEWGHYNWDEINEAFGEGD